MFPIPTAFHCEIVAIFYILTLIHSVKTNHAGALKSHMSAKRMYVLRIPHLTAVIHNCTESVLEPFFSQLWKY